MNQISSLNGKLQYNSLAYLSFLLECDCEICHFNAAGEHMRLVHELSDEYRMKAHEMRDWFGEHATMNGQEVDNMINIRQHVNETQWPALKQVAYDLDTFLSKILERGEVMVDCLENTDDLKHTDERSQLDDFLGYWRKEIEYYTKLTLGEGSNGVLSGIETDPTTTPAEENLPQVSNGFKGTVFAVVKNPANTKASMDGLPGK